ncbi:MAG: hypothetical protein CRN43_20855 [Candidatus Nephrothrix sp. EaCA]|nr:MAG: hypothetical protein CRN43_20855 [Candidatus Nephrothrix sp. EaCA]
MRRKFNRKGDKESRKGKQGRGNGLKKQWQNKASHFWDTGFAASHKVRRPRRRNKPPPRKGISRFFLNSRRETIFI